MLYKKTVIELVVYDAIIMNKVLFCLFYGASRHFQQYVSYIVAVNFIGGGNRRKPPTCCKSLTNFITYCCIEYTSPWTGYYE